MSKKAIFSIVMVMSISACSNMPKSNDLNASYNSNNSEQRKVENLAFRIHELDRIASKLNKDAPAWVALDWNQTQTVATNRYSRYKKSSRRTNIASTINRYTTKKSDLVARSTSRSTTKSKYVRKPNLRNLIRSAKVRKRYKRYNKLIRVVAKSVGIEPEFLHAIVRAESNYNSKAKSYVGAAGLTQLMPATARELGVKNRYNPVQNLYGGARYLRKLLKFFNQNRKLAVAGYNAGPYAVKRHGYKVPPYRETRKYVKKVLSYYKKNKKFFQQEVAYKKMLENSRRYQ
jgi:soluble lytic murein transglycosylase-like protein